ncbi:MAG: 4Fe-4S ferredoxin, partial [Candidatus Eisenbacteria bacterium]
MTLDVFERLAKHLDNLPGGFPRTESGAEIRILQRLFTRDDAELALRLTIIPEGPRVIARRAGIPVDDAVRRLDGMEQKGLILSIRRRGKPPQYSAQQFVVGFWESQVNRLSPELVKDFEEYLPHVVNPGVWQRAPQLRTVPVGQSLSAQSKVMPYERAEELVRAHTKFAVSNCICRQELRLLGKGCNKPEESCMSFGMASEYVVRTGRGRAITQEEALAVLRRAEEVGLVLQPGNAKDALFICTCCGCCC